MVSSVQCFLKTRVTSSHCSFGPTNNPKPEDIQFTLVDNTEKQQILTLEELEIANVFFLFLNKIKDQNRQLL